MKETRNIILVDDHVIVRNGLKELIEKLGHYKISHQFDRGEEFIEAIPQIADAHLIVLDVNMPGMGGDEVMEKLNRMGLRTPVLVLTISDDNDTMVKLFRLGVRGYLMKNCKAAELKNALNDIFDKGYYHNEFLSHSLRTNLEESKRIEEPHAIIAQLTPQEKEFLKLVCDEKEFTYYEIASMMHVQHRTIDGYRASIFKKFAIKSKTGLVLFVAKHKLLENL